MTIERDPREDPRPGDVLKGRYGDQRYVPQIEVEYVDLSTPRASVAYSVKYPASEEPQRCTLTEWQAWARTATVIKRGDQS